jgi:hypothetical protein
MINEIKIDRSKPTWVNVWNGEGVKHRRIYLYTIASRHYCVHELWNKSFIDDKQFEFSPWEFIEFIKEKKRIPLDAKSCPRRPVLTHPIWGEGVEYYASISHDGLDVGGSIYTWKLLFEKDYEINGKPASREVDE